ncbi:MULTISPECIES: hypothetical protein [unclassified Sphingomonas]|uniref:hypothetical protein n=1 Tax=unclassified Sphingomonas TaxID=196159 RepID=UPI002865E080|nr:MULTISPECIES: hypothetical protein [unclassified Sphingomonas]MDR6116232.1 hypothetical protein [Sphingomonas sp. SORGH_AS_0789]MDR6150093.1 hypothetical protein [Sphingomonas sp. SORGH_AS_0742]
MKTLHRASLTKLGRDDILFDAGDGHGPLDADRVHEASVVADHEQRSVEPLKRAFQT